MQNQYPNGNNLTNDPAQTGTKQQSGTKYYIFGMVTGILAAIARSEERRVGKECL